MPPKNDKSGTPKVVPGSQPVAFVREEGQKSGGSGPSVRMVSSERAMKPYTIFETEILAISRVSALSSIAFSFAAGMGSYALKLYYEPAAPAAAVNNSALVATALLAVVFGAVGIWANSWRNEIVRQIRKESGDTHETTSWLDTLIVRKTPA